MLTVPDVSSAFQTLLTHIDAFGLIGLALGLAAGLAPTRRLILLALAGSNLGFAAHFLLLGSATGVAMCVIACLQSLIAVRFAGPQARPVWLGTVFAGTAGLALVLTALSWNGWASAFAGSGAVLATIARLQVRAETMRRYLVAVSLCWAAHDIIVGSIYSFTGQVIALSALGFAVLRERAPSRSFASGELVGSP